MTYNWNRTIGQYIEALESRRSDCWRCCCVGVDAPCILPQQNQSEIPDKIKETPAAVVYLNDWRD